MVDPHRGGLTGDSGGYPGDLSCGSDGDSGGLTADANISNPLLSPCWLP